MHQLMSTISKRLPETNLIENLSTVWSIRAQAENNSNILVTATTGLGEAQKPALN